MLLKATEPKEGKKDMESLQLGHKKPVEILTGDNFSTTQNLDWNLLNMKRKECVATTIYFSVQEFGKEGKQTRMLLFSRMENSSSE